MATEENLIYSLNVPTGKARLRRLQIGQKNTDIVKVTIASIRGFATAAEGTKADAFPDFGRIDQTGLQIHIGGTGGAGLIG